MKALGSCNSPSSSQIKSDPKPPVGNTKTLPDFKVFELDLGGFFRQREMKLERLHPTLPPLFLLVFMVMSPQDLFWCEFFFFKGEFPCAPYQMGCMSIWSDVESQVYLSNGLTCKPPAWKL